MAGEITRRNAPAIGWAADYPEHPVNELLAQNPGPQSPFGDDITFPRPIELLHYVHPGPESRPHILGEY
jgi:hypothetical protein